LQRFRAIKSEIRVVGVDDGVFAPHTEGYALVIGVVFRGGYWLDGVMHTKVKVDGMDANEKIGAMIADSPHSKQLRVVMLNGVTCAGFNVIDIKKLYEDTGLPVIAVTREKPNLADIHKALENLPNSEERWTSMMNAGELLEMFTKGRKAKVYLHIAGVGGEDAEKIVRMTSTRSYAPEPLRVAHLVASGLGDYLVQW
jgi:endonuclease V-like protein UPF0215 family